MALFKRLRPGEVLTLDGGQTVENVSKISVKLVVRSKAQKALKDETAEEVNYEVRKSKKSE